MSDLFLEYPASRGVVPVYFRYWYRVALSFTSLFTYFQSFPSLSFPPACLHYAEIVQPDFDS